MCYNVKTMSIVTVEWLKWLTVNPQCFLGFAATLLCYIPGFWGAGDDECGKRRPMNLLGLGGSVWNPPPNSVSVLSLQPHWTGASHIKCPSISFYLSHKVLISGADTKGDVCRFWDQGFLSIHFIAEQTEIRLAHLESWASVLKAAIQGEDTPRI